MKKLVFVTVLFISSTFGFAIEKLPQTNNRKAKNVILLIGDGMGPAQVYAAYTANKGFLNMYTMPFTGVSITASADNYITDSAAGGTALSSGKKTKNGMIAQDSTGKRMETILEIAKREKKATGIVVTCAITHATPASFYGHLDSRYKQDSIALNLLDGKVDLFVGGGTDYFIKRSDNRNLEKELTSKGYQFCFNLDSILLLKSNKVGCLLAPDGLPKISEGRKNMLPSATHIAIEKLSKNDNGFFLMVEGSQIDWGGHANDMQYVIQEAIDFDKAVGEAIAYAVKDTNTLVVVTADHETGGLTLHGGSVKLGEVKGAFAAKDHTALPVMVYSFGAGAQEFTGVFENTEIFYKMLKAYGFAKY